MVTLQSHRQLKFEPVAVSTPEEFERRLATIAQLHPDAMHVYPDPLTAQFAKVTIDSRQTNDCRVRVSSSGPTRGD